MGRIFLPEGYSYPRDDPEMVDPRCGGIFCPADGFANNLTFHAAPRCRADSQLYHQVLQVQPASHLKNSYRWAYARDRRGRARSLSERCIFASIKRAATSQGQAIALRYWKGDMYWWVVGVYGVDRLGDGRFFVRSMFLIAASIDAIKDRAGPCPVWESPDPSGFLTLF